MAVTYNEVAEIYVATFNRAAAQAELDYWVNDSGLTIEGIAESFFDSPEAAVDFDPADIRDGITQLYQNMFNRDPEQAGLDYWSDQISSGALEINDVIIALVNGAQGTDADTMDNKTAVCIDYADSGLDSANQKDEIMTNVTDDPQTVQDAADKIQLWEDEGTGFQLTTSEDDIVGTTQDDIIEGSVNSTVATSTFQSFDNIDGGSGNDTMNLRMTNGAITATAIVNNIETINITNQDVVDTFDGVQVTGTETINIIGAGVAAASAVNLNNIQNNMEIGASQINDGWADTINLNYVPGVVAADETQTLNLNTNDTLTFNVFSGANTLDVHTGAGAHVLTDVSFASTVNIDGVDGSSIILSGTDSAKTIDASTMTGDVDIRANAISDNGATVTTGSGNDMIGGPGAAMGVDVNAGTTLVVKTGAGNDEVILDGDAGSLSHITGGTGADLLVASTAIGAVEIFHYAKTGDSGSALVDADTINNFNAAGEDMINFDGLASGAAEGTTTATTTSFAMAQQNAKVAFQGGNNYSIQRVGADSYLFVDSNDDDVADSLVVFQSNLTVTSADIV